MVGKRPVTVYLNRMVGQALGDFLFLPNTSVKKEGFVTISKAEKYQTFQGAYKKAVEAFDDWDTNIPLAIYYYNPYASDQRTRKFSAKWVDRNIVSCGQWYGKSPRGAHFDLSPRTVFSHIEIYSPAIRYGKPADFLISNRVFITTGKKLQYLLSVFRKEMNGETFMEDFYNKQERKRIVLEAFDAAIEKAEKAKQEAAEEQEWLANMPPSVKITLH